MSGDDEWDVDTEDLGAESDSDDSEWDVDTDGVEADSDGDDSEWRFSLEDLEEGEQAREGDEEDEVGGNVFGSLQSAGEELEPGSPSLENTAFVALGIVLALLLFAQFVLVLVGGI